MMTFQTVPYTGGRLDASLELAQNIADQWGVHPLLIQMARDITGQWNARNRMEESRAVQAWVRRRVRYVPDPIAAEMIADPLTTIRNGGDCDDMAVLAAALLQAIGHDARIGAVTWKGRDAASHAVVVDLTARCVVDPVGNEPQNWPPQGFEVESIRYRDKAGQIQSMNGLFSKLVKAVAKPFQKVFPAHTLLGKIADPLGLTDPKRNLNLVGRVADVVGTAAALAAGGWAIGAATVGTAGGLAATTGAGFSAVGSALGAAAGKVGTGLAIAALTAAASGKPEVQPQASPYPQGMTADQAAAWAQYGPGAVGYSASGGGGGGGSLIPAAGPMGPGSAAGASQSYAVPLLIAGAVGIMLLSTRKKRGNHV